MTNSNKLYNELTDAFIEYQFRLDNPMPPLKEIKEDSLYLYNNNFIFRHKVKNIVSAVMVITSKYIDKEKN